MSWFFYPPGADIVTPVAGALTSHAFLIMEGMTGTGTSPVDAFITTQIYTKDGGAAISDPCVRFSCDERAVHSGGAAGTMYVRNSLGFYRLDIGGLGTATEVTYEFGTLTLPLGVNPNHPSSGSCTDPCDFDGTGGHVDVGTFDLINGNPVLTGIPGDSAILWKWDPPTTFDARVPLEYGISVVASPGTPASGPTNQFISGTSVMSTGLTNGTAYQARVQAFLAVDLNGVPDNAAVATGRSVSNIASATPRVRREAWGRIAR